MDIEKLFSGVKARTKMKNEERPKLKIGENHVNGILEVKKLNGYTYKKLFENAGQKVKASVNESCSGSKPRKQKKVKASAKESCAGSNRKRQRVALDAEGACFGYRESANEPANISSMGAVGCKAVLKMDESVSLEHGSGAFCSICKAGGGLLLCSGQGCRKSIHRSCIDPPLPNASSKAWYCGPCTQHMIKSGKHVFPHVSKLRDYWHRGQNAVFFDGQDRLLKVVLFVLSLLDNVKQPILIIAASSTLSLWETEILKWSKLTNVVTYKGNKDARAIIRVSEFGSGSTICQVLLSSPDVIVEDLDMFDHIKWQLVLIDECQRPTISTHFQKIKMLKADMKLLAITGETVDIKQSYQNIISLLDPKYEEIDTSAEMETNVDAHTLKERLSPFIPFECKSNTLEFEEYWVPVHLSSMQIKQYCSLLDSNLETLSSPLRNNSSLHDILTQTQKCCDHPYLVDPTLRNSSKGDASIDPLDVDINVSGKMQLLDKVLLEIKRCGLRVLVLYQPVVSSENISTGDILDDLVDRRFGQDSYVRIGKTVFTNERGKKKEALKKFNSVESKVFVCLLNHRACHASVKLSRVDAVILFNSDWNALNDRKALQKVTIDAHHAPLKVFRLYSLFTIEEKTLIWAKQGTTFDHNINWSNCQRLLAWGASYLFSKLKSYTDSCIDDLLPVLASLLRNKIGNVGPTHRSIISNAQLYDGAYSKDILLLGEKEARVKESSVEEYLTGDGPFVFWTNLVKESQLGRKNSCRRKSRRVQKSPQNSCYVFEGFEADKCATTSPSVKTKSTKKRKLEGASTHVEGHLSSQTSPTPDQGEIQRESPLSNPPMPSSRSVTQPADPSTHVSDSIASSSRTNDIQQCKNNQPPPTSMYTPIESEIERIQKEQEKVTKLHQEKESMLLSQCEKEISEVRKKYDTLVHESRLCLTKEIKILEEYLELVSANKLLAENLESRCQDTPDLKKTQPGTGSLGIPEIPAHALERPAHPCSTNVVKTHIFGHNPGKAGTRASAPHLRSNPSLFKSLHDIQTTAKELTIPPLPTFSTPETQPYIKTEPNF